MKPQLEYSLLYRLTTIAHTKTSWTFYFPLLFYLSLYIDLKDCFTHPDCRAHDYLGTGKTVKEQKGKNRLRIEMLVQTFKPLICIHTHQFPSISVLQKPLIPLLLFCLYCRFFSTSPRKGFKDAGPSSGIWRDLLWSSGGNKCPSREYWYETWVHLFIGNQL